MDSIQQALQSIMAAQQVNREAAPAINTMRGKISSISERLNLPGLTSDQREAGRTSLLCLERLKSTTVEGENDSATVDQKKWDAFINSTNEEDIKILHTLSAASRSWDSPETWAWPKPVSTSQTGTADVDVEPPAFPIQWFELTINKANLLLDATKLRRSERLRQATSSSGNAQ